MAKKQSQNAGVVERNDGHLQVNSQELSHYKTQMTNMFRNTQLPAVLYKGELVPRRVLSDFSYLTKG